MFRLVENQIIAIELLAKYKYLTSSQFVKMGVYKKRGYLTNSLKPLIDMKRPLLSKYDFNPIDGKLESFYFLTKYGKEFLISELDYTESQIKLPRESSPIKLKDYFHRRATVNFHISFRQWVKSIGGGIDFFNYYFDKVGNNRSTNKNQFVTAINRIYIDKEHSFIPDANAKFSFKRTEFLFLFEQHNGKDTKRLFEQLCIHIKAISEGVVSKKYNFQNSHRVVVVCEEQSVKGSVIKRLKDIDGIESYINFFIFKTNAELEEGFYSNWTLINGKQVDFF